MWAQDEQLGSLDSPEYLPCSIGQKSVIIIFMFDFLLFTLVHMLRLAQLVIPSVPSVFQNLINAFNCSVGLKL